MLLPTFGGLFTVLWWTERGGLACCHKKILPAAPGPALPRTFVGLLRGLRWCVCALALPSGPRVRERERATPLIIVLCHGSNDTTKLPKGLLRGQKAHDDGRPGPVDTKSDMERLRACRG